MFRCILAAALFLAILCSARADMTLTGVDSTLSRGAVSSPFALVHNNRVATGTSGATVAVPLTGTTVHNFIVVGIAFCQNTACNTANSITISSVISSAGETCSVVPATLGNSQGVTAVIYACPNIVGGSDTITVTTSDNTNTWFLAASANEFSGVVTTSPVDNIGNNVSASGTSTGETVSTTGSNAQTKELIYSVAISAQTPSPAGSFVPINAGFDAWETSVAIATQTATWSWTSTSIAHSVNIAAFKHP